MTMRRRRLRRASPITVTASSEEEASRAIAGGEAMRSPEAPRWASRETCAVQL